MTCNLNHVNVNFLVNVNLFLVIFNQVNVDKKVNVYLGMSGNSLESDICIMVMMQDIIRDFTLKTINQGLRIVCVDHDSQRYNIQYIIISIQR